MGKPVVFCLNRGELGRLDRIEDGGVPGFKNVFYYPPGLFSWAFSPKVIENVPATVADAEPLHPPGDLYKDGLLVLIEGSNGLNWILEKLKVFQDRNWAKIEQEKRRLEIALKSREQSMYSLEKGVDQKLARLKKSQEILEKPSKHRRDTTDFGDTD